ncbi:MAG TPA: hypothetical protein VFV34_06370 [Blastocatellia bacterium]|nr:hypothetical protein [Blastocatellia bacterium]
MAVTHQADIQLFDGEAGDSRQHLAIQIRNRNIGQSSTHAADEVLVTAEVRVKAAHAFWRAHAANKILLFEELKSPVNGSLRKPGKVAAQPIVYRVGSRVRGVFRQRPIDGQPLRCDANAARPAQ